ncbi:hypothetical protein ACTFIT_011126 [Dictyostelium discoideum]
MVEFGEIVLESRVGGGGGGDGCFKNFKKRFRDDSDDIQDIAWFEKIQINDKSNNSQLVNILTKSFMRSIGYSLMEVWKGFSAQQKYAAGMISFWFPRVAFKASINPTHYHVLLDEHQMAADLFQFFTFQMGHLYFDLKNLTVGCNVDPGISDKLYF